MHLDDRISMEPGSPARGKACALNTAACWPKAAPTGSGCAVASTDGIKLKTFTCRKRPKTVLAALPR